MPATMTAPPTDETLGFSAGEPSSEPELNPEARFAKAVDEWRQRNRRHSIESAKIHMVKILQEREVAKMHLDFLKRRLIRRSGRLWTVDREVEVARLAARMDSKPHAVVCELKQTFHGCELLMQRWGYIREAAEDVGFTGTLGHRDRKAVLNLLSVPRYQRELSTFPIDPSPADQNNSTAPAAIERTRAKILAVVQTYTKRLEHFLEVLAEEDREEREYAAKGMFIKPQPELNKCSRAIARCERDLRKLEAVIASEAIDEPRSDSAKSATQTPDSDEPGTEKSHRKSKANAHPRE